MLWRICFSGSSGAPTNNIFAMIFFENEIFENMDPQTFSMLNNTVCTSTTRYLSVQFTRRHAITSIENRDTTAIQRPHRGNTEATQHVRSLLDTKAFSTRESRVLEFNVQKESVFYALLSKTQISRCEIYIVSSACRLCSKIVLFVGAGRSWNPANSCIQIWRIGSSTEFENLNSPLPAPEQATDERFYRTVNWLLKERLFIRYRTVCTEVRTVREPLSVEFKVEPIWIGAFE